MPGIDIAAPDLADTSNGRRAEAAAARRLEPRDALCQHAA
jgi:hypothetical protein